MRISDWSSDVCSSDLLGEARRVSGRLDLYGDMRQIVHPDHVAEPGAEGAIAIHEPVYPLTEGLTNARLSQPAEVALDRRPELAEWIAAPLPASRNWPEWRAEMDRAHDRKTRVEEKSVAVRVTLGGGGLH